MLALAALAGVTLAACGDTESDPQEAGAPEATGAEVTVDLLAFDPDELEVAAGTTVTWLQEDTAAHTIVAGTVEETPGGVSPQPDGTFESDLLETGEQFEHSFDEPGTYPYFCSLHPATMRGEIRVT